MKFKPDEPLQPKTSTESNKSDENLFLDSGRETSSSQSFNFR